MSNIIFKNRQGEVIQPACQTSCSSGAGHTHQGGEDGDITITEVGTEGIAAISTDGFSLPIISDWNLFMASLPDGSPFAQ